MDFDTFIWFPFVFLVGAFVGALLVLILNPKKSVGEQYEEKRNIEKLIRQAARWSTAAKQDKNAMIAVLHANYGAGYLWALLDIATPEQIHLVTGLDVTKFQAEIVKTQDEATKAMARLCPKFAPDKTYLTQLAGEG